MSGKTALAVLAVMAAMAATAGTAHASSIVFVRGGDIWLVQPDGTREHRVTTGGAFTDVTQSDDGRIFATEGNILHSFAPDGTRLAGPTATLPTRDLEVNPEGSKIAFWYQLNEDARFTVMNSDGTSASEWDDQNGWHPTWVRNDMVLHSNAAGWLYTAWAGTGSYAKWKTAPAGQRFHSSDITRAGDRIVAVIRDYENAGAWAVTHYSNTSQPPTNASFTYEPTESEQPTLRCTEDAGGVEPSHPRFSPDGTSIAWEMPDGVVVKPVFDLASCSQPPGGFTLAGARSPDWGPADVPAAAPGPLPPAPVAPCIVPRLKGKTLRAARRSLLARGCRLGAVRRSRSARRPGRVIRQSPKAGTSRPGGTRVNVTVAKR